MLTIGNVIQDELLFGALDQTSGRAHNIVVSFVNLCSRNLRQQNCQSVSLPHVRAHPDWTYTRLASVMCCQISESANCELSSPYTLCVVMWSPQKTQ